ncbi:MAG: hypothetical protein K2Y20_16075 [Sphingomonas sp.]|nr:hypothetical protein [Sphingomonas sp.]
MSAAIEVLLAQARALRTAGQADAATTSYRDAAALARATNAPLELAHALRHLSDLAREAGRCDEALATGSEALTLYRSQAAPLPLDLANALRVTALALDLNDEQDAAVPLWREARGLYAGLGIAAGVGECEQYLPRRAN